MSVEQIYNTTMLIKGVTLLCLTMKIQREIFVHLWR